MAVPEPYPGLDVLLVEDNEDDVELVRRLLARSGLNARLHVATDIDEARELLLERVRPNAELQRVVLIDLQLPSADGRDILRWMQTQPKLGSLNAVVLTSSTEYDRINECLELGCRMYLLKPLDIADIANIVWGLRMHWQDESSSNNRDREAA